MYFLLTWYNGADAGDCLRMVPSREEVGYTWITPPPPTDVRPGNAGLFRIPHELLSPLVQLPDIIAAEAHADAPDSCGPRSSKPLLRKRVVLSLPICESW